MNDPDLDHPKGTHSCFKVQYFTVAVPVVVRKDYLEKFSKLIFLWRVTFGFRKSRIIDYFAHYNSLISEEYIGHSHFRK